MYSGKCDFKALVCEDEAIVKKREACKEMIRNLRKSLDYLNQVREFYFE